MGVQGGVQGGDDCDGDSEGEGKGKGVGVGEALSVGEGEVGLADGEGPVRPSRTILPWLVRATM